MRQILRKSQYDSKDQGLFKVVERIHLVLDADVSADNGKMTKIVFCINLRVG